MLFRSLLVHPAYVTHKKRLDLLILRLVPHFAPFAHFARFCVLCLFCCTFGLELFRTYPDVTDMQITINKPPDQCIIMTSLGFIVLHLHSHEPEAPSLHTRIFRMELSLVAHQRWTSSVIPATSCLPQLRKIPRKSVIL